jgi:cytidylate kinase
MAANVVTLSVQTGSGGFVVARQVSERLGFRYYDWEITSEAADRAGVSPNEVIAAERVPGFVERMMRRLGAASAVTVEGSPLFGELSPAAWSNALQSMTSDDYRQFIERVVLELADRGEAVIVGHASQHTLKTRHDTLRVLIHGSHAKRIERLAIEQELTMDEAKERIKQQDKDRSELLRRAYHFDWLDAGMYDLSINTDNLSLDFAAEAVVKAAKELL